MEFFLTASSGKKIGITDQAGISAADAVSRLYGNSASQELAAVHYDNEILHPAQLIRTSGKIEPVTINSTKGHAIYRRSLNYLLCMAASSCFSDTQLNIGHSIGDSMYFSFRGDAVMTENQVAELEAEMRRLVQEDLQIERLEIKHSECRDFFASIGRSNSLLLLDQYTSSLLTVYRCRQYLDLDHGPLLAHTGLLANFTLIPHDRGLVLVYPPWRNLDGKPLFHDIRVLSSTYREHHRWAEILEVDTVGKLNLQILKRSIKEFIWVAEALQNHALATMARTIREKPRLPGIILIAGPSSSGKTTFAKRLNIQLRSLGIKPVNLSLDDYFVHRDLTPRDEEGNYNFEDLQAIDVELLNSHLSALINGEEIELPRFNFKTGAPEFRGDRMKVPESGTMIVEGIHGLNEQLTHKIPREHKFKIYISALTQINLDEGNRISTTDNRLIRRMVRDYRYRGYSAEETLMRWPSVRKGENHNIFPYQDESDASFNSALDYELGVLKLQAEPLLRQIRPDSEHFGEARRLLHILEAFMPIPREFVPDMSILREFIGGSAFKY